jgi:hypothetical protein
MYLFLKVFVKVTSAVRIVRINVMNLKEITTIFLGHIAVNYVALSFLLFGRSKLSWYVSFFRCDRLIDRGLAPQSSPKHHSGTNFITCARRHGYCIIWISFELCLWSMVRLPGSCVCPPMFRFVRLGGKGRTTMIVLLASLVKHLSGESRKPTVIVSENWSAIRWQVSN